MRTRKATKKRTVLSTALIAGAVIFTLNAWGYLAILIADTVQGVQTGQNWPRRSQPSDWFHLPLMLLAVAVVVAFPIWLWGCVLRRHAVAKHLSATSMPHGIVPPLGAEPPPSEHPGAVQRPVASKTAPAFAPPSSMNNEHPP